MKEDVSNKLKSLNNQIKDLDIKLEVAKNQKQIYTSEINTLTQKKSRLQSEISKIQSENKSITISDHAIIRYIERVIGVNIEDIKAHILTEDLETKIKTLGNGKYPMKDGGRVVVKNKNVVTIID